MNNPAGRITVDVYTERQSGKVVIHSSRAVTASQLLIGKTPEQALAIIPLLFNICGIAQSHAALTAIDQQRQMQNDPALAAARELLVLAETAKEHLARVFIDWPGLFEFELDSGYKTLPYLGKLVYEFTTSLFEQNNNLGASSQLKNAIDEVSKLIDELEHFLDHNVFMVPTARWLSFDCDDLKQWWEANDCVCAKTLKIIYDNGWASQGDVGSKPLPPLHDNDLLEKFNRDDAGRFIAEPDWNGHCYETTAYSRNQQQPLVLQMHQLFSCGLMTRWVARLAELALIPGQMRRLLKKIADNQSSQTAKPIVNTDALGIAQVEAARGRLIHRVEIKDEQIKQYQILAPTEWNFHPRGLLSQSLSRLTVSDKSELEQLARLLINVFDPCVDYQLRIH